MTKQELKDKIGEQIERNIYYMTTVSTNVSITKEFEKNIHLLHEASIKMNEDSDEYNRGLNDAWELARKIHSFSADERKAILGSCWIDSIYENLSVQEALAKVEEYEKNKDKVMPGDVVEYFLIFDRLDSPKSTGIFLHDDLVEHCYWVLPSYGGCPIKLSKNKFKLCKTDEHIDFKYVNVGGSND